MFSRFRLGVAIVFILLAAMPCQALGRESTSAWCPLTVKPVQEPADHCQIAEQTGDRTPTKIGIEDLRQIPKNAAQRDVA